MMSRRYYPYYIVGIINRRDYYMCVPAAWIVMGVDNQKFIALPVRIDATGCANVFYPPRSENLVDLEAVHIVYGVDSFDIGTKVINSWRRALTDGTDPSSFPTYKPWSHAGTDQQCHVYGCRPSCVGRNQSSRCDTNKAWCPVRGSGASVIRNQSSIAVENGQPLSYMKSNPQWPVYGSKASFVERNQSSSCETNKSWCPVRGSGVSESRNMSSIAVEDGKSLLNMKIRQQCLKHRSELSSLGAYQLSIAVEDENPSSHIDQQYPIHPRSESSYYMGRNQSSIAVKKPSSHFALAQPNDVTMELYMPDETKRHQTSLSAFENYSAERKKSEEQLDDGISTSKRRKEIDAPNYLHTTYTANNSRIQRADAILELLLSTPESNPKGENLSSHLPTQRHQTSLSASNNYSAERNKSEKQLDDAISTSRGRKENDTPKYLRTTYTAPNSPIQKADSTLELLLSTPEPNLTSTAPCHESRTEEEEFENLNRLLSDIIRVEGTLSEIHPDIEYDITSQIEANNIRNASSQIKVNPEFGRSFNLPPEYEINYFDRQLKLAHEVKKEISPLIQTNNVNDITSHIKVNNVYDTTSQYKANNTHDTLSQTKSNVVNGTSSQIEVKSAHGTSPQTKANDVHDTTSQIEVNNASSSQIEVKSVQGASSQTKAQDDHGSLSQIEVNSVHGTSSQIEVKSVHGTSSQTKAKDVHGTSLQIEANKQKAATHSVIVQINGVVKELSMLDASERRRSTKSACEKYLAEKNKCKLRKENNAHNNIVTTDTAPNSDIYSPVPTRKHPLSSREAKPELTTSQPCHRSMTIEEEFERIHYEIADVVKTHERRLSEINTSNENITLSQNQANNVHCITPQIKAKSVNTSKNKANNLHDTASSTKSNNIHGTLPQTVPKTTTPNNVRKKHDTTSQIKPNNVHDTMSQSKSNYEHGTTSQIKSKNTNVSKSQDEYDKNDSKWTLKYRKKTDKLVEVTPNSCIYVYAKRFNQCLQIAKNPRELTQMLFIEIFRMEAINTCVFTTNRGPGTYFDERAIEAMFDCVAAWAEKKKCIFDKQKTHNALRQFIVRYRSSILMRSGC